MPDSEPRFTERDVAAILRRAAEIQGEGTGPSDAPGLSGSELVQIGREIGLDVESVRSAIAEHESGESSTRRHGLFGGPARFEIEQAYDAELTDETWEGILALFRRTFSKVGSMSEVGGVREWSGGERELDSLHLSARHTGGSLRIRVLSDLSGWVFLLGFILVFPLLVGVIGISKAGELEVWARVALSFTLVVGGLGLWRWIQTTICRRRVRAIRESFAKLRSVLAPKTPAVDASLLAAKVASDDEQRVSLGEG